MTDEGDGGRITLRIRDGIADLRLNRPAKMNALDEPLVEALLAAAARLRREAGLRAVVMSGEGASFCAGLDMANFAAVASGSGAGLLTGRLADRTHGPANRFQHLALVWRELPVPVIAALHGSVFGGGLQIALGADLRFATPDAQLALLEIRWGIVPDMGGTLLLRDLIGADLIRDLTYTGRILSGDEAARLGLVTRTCPDPHAAALEAAREIAARNPDAIRAAKRLLNLADDATAARILLAESREQDGLLGTPNQMEAVRANMERRSPVFHDRPDEAGG
ncbi:crotonase/enoyl-CoA hydratase family protein [Enterovirga sp.]|uniref:crotonase/enoyl-CoA hydratase family protein n=1 Tax=Enterovirga sp. TaxID=2026350 RepID=UPI002615B1B2|nr:crotonase/enoyl-CoA hydratase family protein [Enterovirga sp.]MDB5589550.1 Enoyl-CoA hydratase/isomerase [Enterovirga sp.]